MSVTAEALTSALPDIAFQEASLDIWDMKYRLRAKSGAAVDQDIDGTFRRVARALADVEKTDELREHWYREFLWALRRGAIPAGRITSNAGALDHKPATSTINRSEERRVGKECRTRRGRAHLKDKINGTSTTSKM